MKAVLKDNSEFKLKGPGQARVRFAPAPTGKLHIGGARTALFNYLFAQKTKGSFVLRIEDTDIERSKQDYEKDIIDSLKWLGIDWDEEYKQSERIDIYKKYLKKLLAENKAYYCFCSTDDLEAQKQEQLARGEPPRYSGKCAGLSKKEQEKIIGQGRDSVIRFRMPSEKVIFNDIVRGKVEFDAGLISDIVIAKDSQTPLYNFAAAVDDFEMKITHIIRGEDHLSNTPKQILLQKALGFSQPKYCHLPLILGPDRSKLSKRHGAVSVSDYRKTGYLPEAMNNFMALLGWNPGTNREIFNINQLINEFSLKKVQKGGAVFNLQKLDWLNGFYIRRKSIEKLTHLCLPYLPKRDIQYLRRVVAIYQKRLKKLSEISELTDYFFKEKLAYDKELLRWKEMTDEQVLASLDKSIKVLSAIENNKFSRENLEKILLTEAENFSQQVGRAGDRGCLLWPLRAALSGKNASAAPFEIAEILGKEKTLKKLEQAKRIITQN